jgi:hypothetical protein
MGIVSPTGINATSGDRLEPEAVLARLRTLDARRPA